MKRNELIVMLMLLFPAFAKDKITVMQWNVGHFSGGGRPYTTVTDDNYEKKLADFVSLANDASIDILSLSEYSVLFADTGLHKKDLTSAHLTNFPYCFIGNDGLRRNYSLNAVFSKLLLENSMTIEFICNEKADMERKNIKATDYYYTQSDINLNGKVIRFVSTHLAFSPTGDTIGIEQVKELIEKYMDDAFVILSGDFNLKRPGSYDLFVEAGYRLANHGDYGDFGTYKNKHNQSALLDNIIVKGFRIENVRAVQSDLSDHIPIMCDLFFDE